MGILSLIIAIFFSFQSSAGEDPYAHLRSYKSPRIQGDILYIEGWIDSHIYDFFSYEAQKLKDVKYVSLNSVSGNTQWSIEIARRIREFGLSTLLEKGNVCASSCVFLFGSGKERHAHNSTWFGIHGARLGAGYKTEFEGKCFIHFEGERPKFHEGLKGCSETMEKWHKIAYDLTEEAFEGMEAAGVSSKLFDVYFSLEEDPHWAEQLNVLKTRDWVLSSSGATQFDLVTHTTP